MLKTGDVGSLGSRLHNHSTLLLQERQRPTEKGQFPSPSSSSSACRRLRDSHLDYINSILHKLSHSIKPHHLIFAICPDPTRFSSKSHRFRSLRRPDGERGRFRLLHGPAHMARLPRADAPPLRRRVRQIHQEVWPLSLLNYRFLSSRFLSIRIQHFSILFRGR